LRDRGATVLQLDLDVTDEQACADAVRRTREELGGLDVLVNNAGVMLLGTIVGADPEDWRRMLDTNVLGVLYMTHAAIDGMVEQGSGDIVNMSSVAGRTARKGAGVYNASKWAVNAFSESLRQEVTGRGVRVSLVGIDLLTVEARIVVASIDTYIRYSEAVSAAPTVSRPGLEARTSEELLAENASLRAQLAASSAREELPARRSRQTSKL
jgi:NADP-dependent 3-hydroxy acid dehydrogenase YdfG